MLPVICIEIIKFGACGTTLFLIGDIHLYCIFRLLLCYSQVEGELDDPSGEAGVGGHFILSGGEEEDDVADDDDDNDDDDEGDSGDHVQQDDRLAADVVTLDCIDVPDDSPAPDDLSPDDTTQQVWQ